MALRSIVLSVVSLTSLAGCSPSDRARQPAQREGANAASSAAGDNITRGTTADGMAGNQAADLRRADEPQSPTSAMPVPGHPEVNEHIVVNEDQPGANR